MSKRTTFKNLNIKDPLDIPTNSAFDNNGHFEANVSDSSNEDVFALKRERHVTPFPRNVNGRLSSCSNLYTPHSHKRRKKKGG